MAKMKSDTLQMYYDEHGTTFRDRLIRDSAKAAANISGWKAGMVNRVQKSGLFRSVLERTANFDRRRTLPAFTRQPFFKWFTRNAHKTNRGDKKVVLFADTYLNYHEPQVGISALRLLNSCGYEVILANVGCCQRPKISHGFLRDAKREGLKTIDSLKEFLDEGLKVVVCEPSCASALNDDLPDLIADTDVAEQLKSGVMMIDVFLADEFINGRMDVSFEPVSKGLAIHGHCHQKALYGTGAMKLLLQGSVETEEIPSGCCGMAGSFGYEKEHYALSEKIGQEILFPAVEQLQKDHEIIACGFSCRHQIQHFTTAKPKHFVEAVKAVKNKQVTSKQSYKSAINKL
jgi:Fe-S oxidoreductase